MLALVSADMLQYLPLVEDEPVAAHVEQRLEKRARIARAGPLIRQEFFRRQSIFGSAAEIHGDAIEHFGLHLARPLQQRRIVRGDFFQRLPGRFHLLLAVVRKIINAREQHDRRRVLNDQRVSIHPGRAAVADHAGHAGVAPVAHGRIQTALVNQPLLVEVHLDVALSATATARRSARPAASSAAPACRARRHRDADIHRLSFGSGEPLDHEIVGPGSKSLTNPLAALIRPVDLHLGALEINRAEIVLDRPRFSENQAAWRIHRHRRHPIRLPEWGWREISDRRVARLRGYFPSSIICRTCGRISAMLGASAGLRRGAIQHFMAERNLFGVGIALQLDVHGSSAREESAAAGRQTAKAPLRHNLPPDPFRQRHRQNLHIARPG